jgi:pimeloyl-ACP methyl ester carboxylesterase
MFIQLGETRLHYLSKGEGPPVVLLHGLGGSLHAWHGVAEVLALHHHVIAVDLRGHGRSSAGGKTTIGSWAKDVEALIGALELPPVALVGHSIGSLVAQHVTVKRPEVVDHLVMVGGISWFEPAAKDAYQQRAKLVEAEGLDAIVDDWLLGALAPRTRAKLPQVVGLLRDMFLRNDAQTYADACRAMAEPPPVDRERIGQPTLLLVGDHDRSTPIAMAEELHREIPVSRVQVVPTAGHWAPLEQPDEIGSAILQFLT